MLSQNDVLIKVQQVFKTSFKVDPQKVTLDTVASDIPGWDSVGHLSLASDLEDAFDIILEVDDLMAMENVRDVVRVIEKKLSTKT
jgi:acyl carrier protein